MEKTKNKKQSQWAEVFRMLKKNKNGYVRINYSCNLSLISPICRCNCKL